MKRYMQNSTRDFKQAFSLITKRKIGGQRSHHQKDQVGISKMNLGKDEERPKGPNLIEDVQGYAGIGTSLATFTL